MTESDLRTLFGENLRRYRNYKGFSQAKLAEILDISPNFISELETGKRWLSSETLLNLSKSLGVEPYEFLKPLSKHEEKITEFIENYTRKATLAASNAVIQSLDELNKQFVL